MKKLHRLLTSIIACTLLLCFCLTGCGEQEDKKYDVTIKYLNTRYEAHFEDYKNIEELYFVKEISIDDYNENYDVENNIFGRKYEHSETLAIPQEAFELNTGYVCIGVYQIAYIPSKNLYCIAGGANNGLKYEVLNNGKVKISEPETTVYSDPQ